MKPDKLEKSVRFGCGFTFGLFIGFISSVQWVADTWGGIAVIIFSTAIISGFLAVKYGDKFWYSIKDWLL
jgi:hypothetical protein